MSKTMKAIPLVMVAMLGLTACDPAVELTPLEELINSLPTGELTAEDAKAFDDNELVKSATGDYTTCTMNDLVYQPFVFTNPDYYEEAVEDLDQTNTITYYSNNIITVEGEYSRRGWNGETSETTGGFGELVEYNYGEVIYADDAANTIDVVYTRDEDVNNAYSFHKAVSFNYDVFDALFQRMDMGTYLSELKQYAVEYFTLYADSYGTGSDPIYPKESITGVKSVAEDGTTSVTVTWTAQLEILPLYSCELVWGSEYANEYCVRYFEFVYTYTIVDQYITHINVKPFSFEQKVYYDRNLVELPSSVTAENSEIPEDVIAQMDLREVEAEGGFLMTEQYDIVLGYEAMTEYDVANLPDASLYREGDATDRGDGYFFDMTTDLG